METYTIDRFEGDYAVALLRKDESVQQDISKTHLPSDVREGDLVKIQFDALGQVKQVNVLRAETEEVRKKAESLLQKILDKNN